MMESGPSLPTKEPASLGRVTSQQVEANPEEEGPGPSSPAGSHSLSTRKIKEQTNDSAACLKNVAGDPT